MTKSQARRSTNYTSVRVSPKPATRSSGEDGPVMAPPVALRRHRQSFLPSFLPVPPPQGTRVCVDVTRAEKRSEIARRKRKRERAKYTRKKLNQSVHFAECLQRGDRGRLKPDLIFSGSRLWIFSFYWAKLAQWIVLCVHISLLIYISLSLLCGTNDSVYLRGSIFASLSDVVIIIFYR